MSWSTGCWRLEDGALTARAFGSLSAAEGDAVEAEAGAATAFLLEADDEAALAVFPPDRQGAGAGP